jgi:hypothetical protein
MPNLWVPCSSAEGGGARRKLLLIWPSWVAEALLELNQGAGKVGHRATKRSCVRDPF